MTGRTGLIIHAYLLLSAIALETTATAGERHALLIGVSEYASPQINRLEGPAHDLVAIKRALIRHWQFKPRQINALMNSQATETKLKQALSELPKRLQRGDYLFLYFSGHGTSAHDPEQLWPMPYGTGAVVPYDAQFDHKGKLDRALFSRSDIRPVLESLESQGVTVLAIFDTCYSEHATRGLGNASYRVITSIKQNQTRVSGENSRSGNTEPEPYPYKNVYMISAAGADELALDLDYKVLERYSTLDNVPHGALTDALLRVLSGKINGDTDKNGVVTHQELFNTTRLFMGERGYAQRPRAFPVDIQGVEAVSATPLFSGVTR